MSTDLTPTSAPPIPDATAPLPDDPAILQQMVRSRSCPQGLAQRAHIILLAFERWQQRQTAKARNTKGQCQKATDPKRSPDRLETPP